MTKFRFDARRPSRRKADLGAGFGRLTDGCAGQAVMERELHDARAVVQEQTVGQHQQRIRPLADHDAPLAFHRSVVAGDELRRDHAFELISGLDADESIDRGMALPPDFLRV
jgi:hypothetical protein